MNVIFSFVSPSDEGPPEIYLWDGNTMMNLRQNLEGADWFPVWNNQNELAFLAVTGERNGLYVWDGVSYRDGAPDAASYHQIAPGMTAYYSSPTWTTDGSIAFGVQLPADQRSQVYRWDGESLVNISQNPDAHNGGETWNDYGYWAFVTYFSPEQLIFICDPDNNTLLETEGQYTPAWSCGNELAFCRMERSTSNLDWILSIWNETTLTEIARGDEIYAKRLRASASGRGRQTPIRHHLRRWGMVFYSFPHYDNPSQKFITCSRRKKRVVTSLAHPTRV